MGEKRRNGGGLRPALKDVEGKKSKRRRERGLKETPPQKVHRIQKEPQKFSMRARVDSLRQGLGSKSKKEGKEGRKKLA